MSRWGWWLSSDTGLIVRIAIGGGVFLFLAIIDLYRNRSRATRWREYAFLLAATVFAMLYGILNDAVASRISWEYFFYGKGLYEKLGQIVPPEPGALQRAAIGIGLRATWTVGLLIGAILLIANNPRPNRPSLPYRKLFPILFVICGVALLFAPIGGILGSHGWLNWTSAELADLWQKNEFRPPRFLAVYGINLGGYVGGAVGTILAVGMVRRGLTRPNL